MSFSLETNTYTYDKNDFDLSCTKSSQTSIFKLLNDGYNNAYKSGLFSYSFDSLDKGKIIEGNRKLFLALIPERKSKRRKPDIFKDCNAQFDHDAFNFTKIKPFETIFIFQNKDETEISANHLVINASPMATLHSLIVPRLTKTINQVLDEYAINLSLQFMLLLNLPHLVAGFNSLCAAASINHQHFHIWPMYNQQLFIHSAKVTKINKAMYRLVDPILNAFAFQLINDNLNVFTMIIYKVVQYLQSHNIPYNFIMCRAVSFEKSTVSSSQTSLFVTVFVFPRIKHEINKEEEQENLSFGIACAELAGFVPVFDSKAFDELKQDDIEKALQKYMMDEQTFQSLINAVIN